MSADRAGELLASFTTLGLGGVAERLTVAATEADLVSAVRGADGPLLVLAGGSNVVISDKGFAGTVVLVRTSGITQLSEPVDGQVVWRIAAGHPWDEACAAAVEAGLSGIECLSGVPGSTGATPVQNVGAYGQDVAERIVAVRAYDRRRDETVTIEAGACGFTYRSSMFKRNERYVILSADFRLSTSRYSSAIRYAELARALGVSPGDRAPLEETRRVVLALRAGKGMVLDPQDPDSRSVGSFFTNPIVEAPVMTGLRERAAAGGLGEVPAWPAGDGRFKISAAWLIERAGFSKGHLGDGGAVAVSTKHTLALTHRGGGSTEQLLGLARAIRDAVESRFGVVLHPEPVLVGCDM